MTVTSQLNRTDANGDGATTEFDYPYYFLLASDLKVRVSGVLVDSNSYEVVGAGEPSGGTITFDDAPADGATVTIINDPEITQETDYAANDDFPAESHEQALDRLTLIAQYLRSQTNKSLRLSDGDAETEMQSLPAKSALANAVLGFDSDGEPMASGGTSGDVAVNVAMVDLVQADSENSAVDFLEEGNPFTDVASAATVDLGAVASSKVRITGSTGPITSFGTAPAGVRRAVRLASTPTITYHATSLILPGDASIVGQADDEFEAVSLGSGAWYVGRYQRGAYPPATNTPAANLVTSKATNAAMQTALGVRRELTANERYYIAPAGSGGSDANDGLSALTPKLTFETLYNTLRDTIDTKSYTVAFTIAAGAYTQSFVARGALTGVKDQAECSIEFASGVSISTTGMPCLDAYDGAICKFSGNPTCTASGAYGYGIRIWKDANVTFGGMDIGACSLYQVYIAGAYGRLIDDVTLSDDAKMGVLVEVKGGFDKGGFDFIFTNTPTYSGVPGSAFLVAGEGCYFADHTGSYSGTFNGLKYYISDLAVTTPISALENIPGSLEGVWTNPIVTEPQGRLTLEDGVPVSTSDQLAKTTLHYEPHVGDYAPFSLNGTNVYEMVTIGIAGLSLALDSDSGHTGYHQSGKNYDVFLYRRGATAIFQMATGPAWTNDTTRASAISKPNGIWANTSSMTVRFGTGSGDTESLAAGQGVYIGTIRCTANGQTEDSAAKRFVWNAYNRVPRAQLALESDDSWTYSVATLRQMNNDTANQVEFVRGLNEDSVDCYAQFMASASTGLSIAVGIGLDSTSAMATGCLTKFWSCTTVYNSVNASWRGLPGLGYHYLAALEYGNAGGTITWYGDTGVPSLIRNGISATVRA